MRGPLLSPWAGYTPCSSQVHSTPRSLAPLFFPYLDPHPLPLQTCSKATFPLFSKYNSRRVGIAAEPLKFNARSAYLSVFTVHCVSPLL